jgi:hypothetical protein
MIINDEYGQINEGDSYFNEMTTCVIDKGGASSSSSSIIKEELVAVQVPT